MDTDPPSRPCLDRAALTSLGAPWTVEVVEESPSTNAALAVRAREGASEGLVLVTEHQTAGRGRLDRAWVTPPRAALTFSVLLRPPVEDRWWPWLPLLAGVSVVDAVREAGGPACSLKWPNDVLVEGRKLAGLLAERVEGPAGPGVVVGIGVNVSQESTELPVDTATSLALEGATVDRTRLLGQLLEELGRRFRRWAAAGGDPERSGLAGDYDERCVTLGQRVRVQLPPGTFADGLATGIDGGGSLVVDVDGRSVAVSAGDVVHVRPAP